MRHPDRELVRARSRRRDIEQILRHRGADVLDLEGLLDVAQATRSILTHEPGRRQAVTFDDVRERLDMWCETHAPSFAPGHIASVALVAMRSPLPFIADAEAVAERFNLLYAERSAWGITTIGAIDADKRERTRLGKMRKRERQRRSKAALRRVQGVVPRSEYLARSLSREQPWLKAGVSRATWYRRLKAAVETSPSPPNLSEGRDTLVSTGGSASPQDGTGNGRGCLMRSALHPPRSAAYDHMELPSLGKGRDPEKPDRGKNGRAPMREGAEPRGSARGAKKRPRSPSRARTKNVGPNRHGMGKPAARRAGSAEMSSAAFP